jgi:DNA replication protein DnaC
MTTASLAARTAATADRCPDHPENSALHCGPCRSELIGASPFDRDHGMTDGTDPDRAARAAGVEARRRRVALNRWTAMCDPEFADATMADVPGLATDDAAVIYAWLDAWNAGADPLPWLSIFGPVGTGKTHLLHALARAAVTGPAPAECIVVTAPQMYASLRPGAATPEVTLFQYQTTPLLVIDDIGANKASDWVEEKTHDILNDRYRRRLPVLFTTNLEVDDLKIAIGARMASRLRQRCLRVVLEGEDRRRPPTLESLAAATAAALEASGR